METNIYYQLAQTECALDRCKVRLFKKNLALIGVAGIACIHLWCPCCCRCYLDND